MVRIPYFGSKYIVYDLIFYVINIRNDLVRIDYIDDMGTFIGGFIRLAATIKEDPYIQNTVLQYDISSQVKENLTTLQSLEAPDYIRPPDSSYALGYRIVHADTTVLMPDLIGPTDITIS